MLYVSNIKGEGNTLFVDFHTIRDLVIHRIPESSLYRLFQKRCKSYRYRDKDLFPLKALLEIPELAPDLKINGTDE
jgi:hypothetical protein